MSIDFHKCLSALSDVIVNRPAPLRLYDQIYMKIPDILLHAELAGRWFEGKNIVFVGDGDAIALAMIYLSELELIPGNSSRAIVLDFDERQVNSINQFATSKSLTHRIEAKLYNVADPLPPEYWQSNDGFHINPPWGASNNGSSVHAFIQRGIECCKAEAVACVVIADDSELDWSVEILHSSQRIFLDSGFRVAEMLPRFHSYHLDDSPDLKSCCMMLTRNAAQLESYASFALEQSLRENFYGRSNPLNIRYIRDLTAGGKFVSRDYKAEPIKDISDEVAQ